MRPSHRGTEQLAELTREVGAVLYRIDDVACRVLGGLGGSSNGDGQARDFGPEEHEELCGLAAAMLSRLDLAINRIKNANHFQVP